MRPFTRRLIATSAACLLVAGLASCSSDSDGNADGSNTTTTAADGGTTTDDPTTSTDETTSTTHIGQSVNVNVYFVRGEDIATGGRTTGGPTVGRQAIDALLAGPDANDSGAGLRSEIPAGTELLDLEVSDGVATIDLSSEFVSGGGSLSMQLRVAQVVFTLTQFPTVEKVVFLIDGEEVDGLGGEGLATTYEGRSAFEDVTPMILAESPTPGAIVRSPITIEGISNTFEANVQYRVTAEDGTLLDKGFTTATAGSGTWGTFSITSDVGDYVGPATITLSEESAEDGRPMNAYDVPIMLG